MTTYTVECYKTTLQTWVKSLGIPEIFTTESEAHDAIKAFGDPNRYEYRVIGNTQ